MFCLAGYDAIGFDLDHTLAKYKLVDLMNVWQYIFFKLIMFYQSSMCVTDKVGFIGINLLSFSTFCLIITRLKKTKDTSFGTHMPLNSYAICI